MAEMSFEREVLDRLIAIEQKLDGFSNAKAKTYENEKAIIQINNDLEEQEKRIAALEDCSKWLSRTIVAAVIVAAVGIVFALIKAGAGF